MGRVYKPGYTRMIPMNAPIVSHQGGPGVWITLRKDEKPRFARLTGKPGRIRVPVDDWYIEFTDAAGKSRCIRIGPDKEVAEAALLEMESKARLQRATMKAANVRIEALASHTPRPLRPKALRGIEGLFELDMSLFPFLSAVYFLSLEGEVVYVGQSVNFLRRVVKHMEEKVFDAVSYIPTHPAKLEETEKHYIRTLRPKHNLDEGGAIRFGWRIGRHKHTISDSEGISEQA